jgi:HEPN domain-containing protein/predicted nucleotidyltransferase
MVVLFGSHARGDWVEDPETGYRSDYDLLVVVENPEVAENHSLWARVREALSPLASPSTVTLIVHDVRELNQEIRRGQFFFAELWEQGVVLYDEKRFILARPKATTAEERKALAQEYFDHWYTTAGQFFTNYQDNAARGWNPIAAFQLHQAAERYFASMLLVFTGTKPTTHDLEKLSELVSPLHPLLAEPFPRAAEEDERLFDLLRRAYIEARYKKSYRITAEELATLGARALDLAGRVERACREKIESFG